MLKFVTGVALFALALAVAEPISAKAECNHRALVGWNGRTLVLDRGTLQLTDRISSSWELGDELLVCETNVINLSLKRRNEQDQAQIDELRHATLLRMLFH